MGIEEHRVFAHVGKCRWTLLEKKRRKKNTFPPITESFWVLAYTKAALRKIVAPFFETSLNNLFLMYLQLYEIRKKKESWVHLYSKEN